MRERISYRVRQYLDSTDEALRPVFYSVSGSHLYGFPDHTSDVDVRGFHCASGVQYMLFDEPSSQVKTVFRLGKGHPEVDAVSYELRMFALQISKGDFNAIEMVFSDWNILSEFPDIMDELRSVIRAHQFGELSVRYLGMARSLYDTYIATDGPKREKASVKQYLYALRGVLAAKYVISTDSLELHFLQLAEATLSGEDLQNVKELIGMKQENNSLSDCPELGSKLQDLISRQIQAVEVREMDDQERQLYRQSLEQWMVRVRNETRTR